VSAGTFASDVTLDGSAGKKLVINGAGITGAVSGASAAQRRDALVAAINLASAATGVVASAVPGTGDFALTAADGRNISIETDSDVSAGSINALGFGFATGLTATGALTTVVARGGVRLSASGPVGVAVAGGGAAADQITGEGTTGIQAALDELRAVQDRAVVPLALVGARLGWLGLVDERLADEGLVLASDLSRTEGLDLAPAAAELAHLEQVYQAAMASSARLMQLTLLDFLK
jgi:flagellin-like hook-associated protein FlgL